VYIRIKKTVEWRKKPDEWRSKSQVAFQ